MSRGTSVGVQAAAAAATVYPILFAYFNMAGGALRVCTHNQSVSWNSQTWTGIGDFGKVSAVKESSGVKANGLTFGLSGIPSALIAEVIGLRSRGRACTLWLGFYDSSGNLISSPFQLWSGRMDQPVITDTGENSEVMISAESRLIDLQRSREVRYTDETQQNLYAGDLGCEFVASLQEKEIVWGRASTTAPAAVSGAYSGGRDYQEN